MPLLLFLSTYFAPVCRAGSKIKGILKPIQIACIKNETAPMFAVFN
ncbi:hypothetical protein TREAZ_0420 [Leadbettera azotonutricia ZAS-9]|uniref:Uncharacterized protein n=1 Tax=Leadbettera azotonutricia (strain ATCC BAA-888 / DSM 13862 / ZAS-9) TaxID=545695 RepID=F5YCV4_LEAAZ|nr:hypothetical protein TREAZ_0420 [Leadbettera azotonutricia ZAS-9]